MCSWSKQKDSLQCTSAIAVHLHWHVILEYHSAALWLFIALDDRFILSPFSPLRLSLHCWRVSPWLRLKGMAWLLRFLMCGNVPSNNSMKCNSNGNDHDSIFNWRQKNLSIQSSRDVICILDTTRKYLLHGTLLQDNREGGGAKISDQFREKSSRFLIN